MGGDDSLIAYNFIILLLINIRMKTNLTELPTHEHLIYFASPFKLITYKYNWFYKAALQFSFGV